MFVLTTKSWKNHPQKLLRKTQIHFFSLTASTAQMAQTEEFMFQNVAYRPTVYRTGAVPQCTVRLYAKNVSGSVQLRNCFNIWEDKWDYLEKNPS